MQSIFQKISKKLGLSLFALFAAVAISATQANAVVTSGQATIHNAVTVNYKSGTQLLSATASVDVTVTTLAAAPTIVAAPAVTLLPGDVYSYQYTVTSNANGPDTYTPGPLPSPVAPGVQTNITGTTFNGFTPASISLWGGVAISSAAAVAPAVDGTIVIPAGSEVGLTAGTTIINVGGSQYLVAAIAGVGGNPIAIATTNNATGITTPENSAVITLTPIGAAPAITAATVGVGGLQVGEVGTFTLDLTAGIPANAGTDGTIVIPTFPVTTTATDAAGAPIATGTPASSPITVSSPSLTITKLSRNVTAGVVTPVATGTTARPGEVIEYQITVSNNSGATAQSVSISDAIPTYVAILPAAFGAGGDVQITSTVGGVAGAPVLATVAADADVATLAGGTLNVNLGTGATNLLGGSIAAGDSVVILYQVTVQ